VSHLPNDWREAFLKLWWERQRVQWEVWARRAERDLDALDRRLYRFCLDHADALQNEPGREGEILRRRAARVLVDSRPEVAACRNWIDRALFVEGGRDHPEPARGPLREQVLALMNLRTEAAQETGHSAYPGLVMSSEELDPDAVQRMVSGLAKAEEAESRALMARSDVRTPDESFARLGGIDSAAADVEARGVSRHVLQRLGLEEALDGLRFEVSERAGASFVAECGRGDVRLTLTTPVTPGLLLHELGHAVGRVLNEAAGAGRLLPASTDEAFAVLMEHIGFATPEVEEMLGAGDDAEAARVAFRQGAVLETARLSASFRFEMALWRDRSDPEGLYRECYGEAGINVEDETAWCVDSFRSLDPVYVHTYVVGRLVAEATLEHLRTAVSAVPSSDWGRWLVSHWYREGAARSLPEKAGDLGARDPFAV
jgi:hypothetical protein